MLGRWKLLFLPRCRLPASSARMSTESAGATGSVEQREGLQGAMPESTEVRSGDHTKAMVEEEEDTLPASVTKKAVGDKFLEDVFRLIMEEVVKKGTNATGKVCEWKEPAALRAALDLELRSNGEPSKSLLEHCQDIIRYSIKTGHPRFFNQLFSGLDRHALAGRMITEALNTSQATFETAPVFVLMEEVVLQKLRELIGWQVGDGIFCPGGSISNMYAMNLARYRLFPQSKQKGMQDLPVMAVFTSAESHYSVMKGAAFIGIGTDKVFVVKADERGKMIPGELEEQIQEAKSQGIVPFLVSATCGTTVYGAFDPLREIADVCEKHEVWLHVDAAWGGSALLSRQHRHLLDGIGRADSVAWNPHKMLMAGLQCSVLLLKDTSVLSLQIDVTPGDGSFRYQAHSLCKPYCAGLYDSGLMKQCHSASASYLFQSDKFYDLSYDTGDKSIQCGRRVDCLKLWLMWKANGTDEMEKRVDRAFKLTRFLLEEVKKRDGFRLLLEPEFVNVCFWYIPPSLRGCPESEDYWEKLGKVATGGYPGFCIGKLFGYCVRIATEEVEVAPAIKERMMKKGSMMVGYQPNGDHVNFFRQIVINPELTEDDMTFLLDEIERLGEDL